MNPIENLKTFPSKPYTNVTGRERILFVDPKDAKRGTTPPVNYMELQTLASLVNSGSMQFENIDYTTLYNKSVNGELVPGQWYRLTDYKSVNFLNGYRIAQSNPSSAPNFDPREVYQGTEEVLLLQAITEYDIAPIGYSETYPEDIVQYTSFVDAIGVPLGLNNGGSLPDSSTISGFDLQWDGTNVYFEMPTGYPVLFGHPFYLYMSFSSGFDSLDNYYLPLNPTTENATYPVSTVNSRIKIENNGTKIILLDLVEQDYLDYDSNSLYVETVYKIDDAYGWITKRTDTIRNITAPFDFRARKYRRFECEVFGLITSIGYLATGTTATDGTYIVNSYASTTVQGSAATFKVVVSGGAVTSVSIYNPGRLFAIGETITIDGISIGGSSGTDNVTISILDVYSQIDYFGQGHYYNGATSTGNYKDFKCFDNLGGAFNILWNDAGSPDMDYGLGINDNVVIMQSFIGNVINAQFSNNTLRSCNNNFIDSDFNRNTITGDFYYNEIGKSFSDNIIADGFYNNIIKSGFFSNTLLPSFNGNNINIGFSGNVINDSFINNDIGNYFSNNIINAYFQNNSIENNFQSNNIGTDFQGNVILSSFSFNDIESYFYNNEINNTFYNNIIGNYFQSNIISTQVFFSDFVLSGATHVYGVYNCTIFLRSNGTTQLSYVDGTNTVQYTSITA